MTSLHISVSSKKQHQNTHTPVVNIPYRRASMGKAITRTRHHSFHSTSTSRPVAHDLTGPTDCYRFLPRSEALLPKSQAQPIERSRSTERTILLPVRKRSLSSAARDRMSIASKQATGSSLRAPFNTEILTSARRSPDKDLDQLATQLLEQLEVANRSSVDGDSSNQNKHGDCASSLSSKPASFVRVRPRDFTTGNQEKQIRANDTNRIFNGYRADESSKVSSPVSISTSADKRTLTSRASTTSSVSNRGGATLPFDSLHGNPKRHTFRTLQQSCGSQGSMKQGSVTHPSLDIVHANIIDLSKDHQHNESKRTDPENGLVKLLRRAKAFGNIRFVKDHLVAHQTDNEERLGLLLTPPPGSCHFDVQLVLCGLLRRNAASPYELYNFFLENGFFAHLSLPPDYKKWAAEYSGAIKSENPFYREGIRVGLEGDMDFLRTIFQTWCDAWHDWRASRPIPTSRRA